MPLLKSGTWRKHKTLYWYWADNRTIREGKWKLVWARTRKCWELFNMESDRTETKGLAGDFPDLVNQLEQKWFIWGRQIGVVSNT